MSQNLRKVTKPQRIKRKMVKELNIKKVFSSIRQVLEVKEKRWEVAKVKTTKTTKVTIS